MNSKSQKRLYNKKNKTVKSRKQKAGAMHKPKINLEKITDFAHIIPEKTYLVLYADEEDQKYDDINNEFIGNPVLIDHKNKELKFKCVLFREYDFNRDEYSIWKKNGVQYKWSFDDIEVYSLD